MAEGRGDAMPAARTVGGRGFRLLWAGQSMSAVGDGIAFLAIPLLVLERTGNPLYVALAATPRTMGYLVAGLAAGPLVDRGDARRIMVRADLVRLAVFLLLPALAGLGLLPIALVLALAVVAAVCGVFFDTAQAVLLQDLLAPEQLVRGNARLQLTAQLGGLMGPALLGLLAATAGLRTALVLDAATFAVSVGSLLLLGPAPAGTSPVPAAAGPSGPPVRGPRARTAAVLRALRVGLGFVWRTPVLRALAGLQFAVNLLVGAETLIVFFASRSLGAGPATIGVVIAVAAAGGLVGAALAGRLPELPPGSAVGGAVVALGLALAGMAAAPTAAALALPAAVLGGAGVFGTVHIRALRQRLVPRELLGRVTATAGMLGLAGKPLGSAAAGVAAAAAESPRPVFLVAGLVAVACGVLGVRWLPAGVPAEQSGSAAESPANG